MAQRRCSTIGISYLEGPVGPQIEKLSDGSYKYLTGGANQINLRLSRDPVEKMNHLKIVDVKEIK